MFKTRPVADRINDRRMKEGGYTLLEMAVVILVVGLVVAAVIPLYNLYQEKMKISETSVNQRRIDIALNSFREVRGRYPCPARYDVGPGHPDYGMESDCGKLTLAPGQCANGICAEQSIRQVTLNDGTSVFPIVYRGSLPFVSLSIPEGETFDGYDMRFSYAVTNVLTDKAEFRPSRGGIEIVDAATPTPRSQLGIPGSAQYMVFSHGQDRVGAYTQSGTQFLPCTGQMRDVENCNTSSTDQQAIYRYTQQSTVPINLGGSESESPGGPSGQPGSVGNLHYDDYADYVSISDQVYWERGEDTSKNLQNYANLHNSVFMKHVVMGTDKVDSKDDIDSSGIALVVEGKFKARDSVNTEQYCDMDGNNCIKAVLFAGEEGDPERLRCATSDQNYPGESISESKVNCVPPTICGVVDGVQTYATAVDELGRFTCEPPGRCPTISKDICGASRTLPETPNGGKFTLTGGASRSETYTCENKKWVGPVSTGVCTCTARDEVITKSCGANMTGTIVQRETVQCPAGNSSTTIITNSCQCAAGKRTWTEACPAGYEGSGVTKEQTVVCNSNKPSVTTVVKENSCVCKQTTQKETINCPGGFDGKITRQRKSECGNTNWSLWEETSNTCKCKAPYDKDEVCGPEYNTGKITKKYTYQCDLANGTFTLKNEIISNTCGCTPHTQVTESDCPTGYKGKIKTTRKTTCVGGKVSNAADVVDDSQCKPELQQCTLRIAGARLGPYKSTYREGTVCEFTVGKRNESACATASTCYRTLGTDLAETYQCSCQ